MLSKTVRCYGIAVAGDLPPAPELLFSRYSILNQVDPAFRKESMTATRRVGLAERWKIS